MAFIDTVYQKLQRHPKRIVFPEGNEPRVLQAAAEYVARKLGPCVVLGDRDEIADAAKEAGVGLVKIHVINPKKADDMDEFCRRLMKLSRYKHLKKDEAHEMLLNPNYFGTMMLQNSQVDGLVSGAGSTSGSVLRPIFSLVKPLPGRTFISSCMVMQVPEIRYGISGLLFFADCGVVPDPTVEQLVRIALDTARLARQLTGVKPRVAMLSYSTRGSARTPHTEKIQAAAAAAMKQAREEHLDVEVDGEIQVDAALVPEIAATKAPDSGVAGQANVLIFPDLNSGNISTKLVQRLASTQAWGQLLIGASKPAADISRGADSDSIMSTAALVGLQAIAYRELHPDDPRPLLPAIPTP